MAEYCNDQWAEPPEGIPTWCVTADWTWNLWLQLALELLVLFILAMFGSMLKKWWVRRKREKQQQEYQTWKKKKGLY